MANYPNTVKKIQVKKADGTFLFPRVRTTDMTAGANDTAAFDANDKLKLAHIPYTSSIRANGVADNTKLVTEKAVRDAVSSIEAGLSGAVNSVTGDADQPVYASPTTGAVKVGISATTGDGTTRGYAITKEVASGSLDAAAAACGISAVAGSGSTTLVPTWNTFYGVTSMLQLKIDGAGKVQSVESGNTGISCNPTTGNVKVYNTGVLTVKGSGPITPATAASGNVEVGIAYATINQSGAVRLATSSNVYSNDSAAQGYVLDLTTVNRYRGAMAITSDYTELTNLNALPTGVADGDIVLVKTGTNAGYYGATGTKLARIDASVQDSEPTNVGIGYNKNTGIAYVKNGDEYIPLVRSATGDLIKVNESGVVYLTESAVSLIHGAANVTNKIASTNVIGDNGLSQVYAGANVSVVGRDVANLGSLPETPTAAEKKTIKGVVETINDITSTGISAVSAAAIAKGVHTAANWATALSNNIVPTVHAVTAACLFYSEI